MDLDDSVFIMEKLLKKDVWLNLSLLTTKETHQKQKTGGKFHTWSKMAYNGLKFILNTTDY